MKEVQINRRLKLREDGKVFNIKTGEEVFPAKTSKGYIVTQNGKNRFVHQLMMEYFGSPKPGPEYIILHDNKNNYDNRIDNLKWGTIKDVGTRKSTLPVGHRKCDLTPEEYRRERGKQNYEKNGKNYYEKNHDRILNQTREYRENNRDKVNESSRKWYQNHKEQCAEMHKNWTIENRSYVNEKQRIRYNTNPEVREKNKELCKQNYKSKYGIDKEYTEKEKERARKKSKGIKHKVICKIWLDNNHDKALENRKNWMKNNPEREKENRNRQVDRIPYKDLT